MNVWVRTTILTAGACVLASAALAAPPTENGLAGIKLYDTGVDVVKKFGSPTEVMMVASSSAGAAAGRGGGSQAGTGSADAGGSRISGGGGVSTPGVAGGFIVPPLSLRQMSTVPAIPPDGGGPAGGPGGTGSSGGFQSQMPEGSFFVRWVYQRGGGTSINFVINKFNKVVQIEAMGIAASNVRTEGGIRLGSTIQDVMTRYETPDSYDVGGDYFMVKFLRASQVAFRFTRETPKMPFRVTGIVVSAGKSE